jgi:hypothetical protein
VASPRLWPRPPLAFTHEVFLSWRRRSWQLPRALGTRTTRFFDAARKCPP